MEKCSELCKNGYDKKIVQKKKKLLYILWKVFLAVVTCNKKQLFQQATQRHREKKAT